jgi:hypothetical protein
VIVVEADALWRGATTGKVAKSERNKVVTIVRTNRRRRLGRIITATSQFPKICH